MTERAGELGNGLRLVGKLCEKLVANGHLRDQTIFEQVGFTGIEIIEGRRCHIARERQLLERKTQIPVFPEQALCFSEDDLFLIHILLYSQAKPVITMTA